MSKQTITSFNPASAASGSFKASAMAQNRNPQTGLYGYLLWANESPVSLIVQVNTDIFRIHPWQLEKIELKQETDIVSWSQEFTLTNSSSAPVSLCLIDGYTSDEPVGGNYPIQLVRSVGTVTTAFQAQELVTQDLLRAVFIDDTSFPGTVIFLPIVLPSGSAIINMALAAQNNGVDQLILQSDVANNALLLKMALKLELNTGTSLSGVQIISGTGSGVVSHSLGVTPTFAVLSPTNVLTTYDISNYTSTSVTVNMTSSGTWKLLLFA